MRHLILGLAALAMAGAAHADATVPTEDIAGVGDSSVVGRLEGSFIVSYLQREFDEIEFPTAVLEEVEDARDAMNNRVFRPATSVVAEGARTRIVYVSPEGASTLQVVRAYQDDLEETGASLIYDCRNDECGGSATRSSSGGGGSMSLSMYLWPESSISEEQFTNGSCAQRDNITEQRYALMELPEGGGYVSIHAYQLEGGTFCEALGTRVVAAVDILQTGEMEAELVTVDASAMQEAITAEGRIALYGITFATGSAEITADSAETLGGIAELLNTNTSLRLLVAGHTDNVGSYDFNLDLSNRRAQSVVSALTGQHGIDAARLYPVGVSFASPVATNATEEGRAQNRRVELVSF